MMNKETFSVYMKILFLAIIFMCPAEFASAPTKDFTLKVMMLRKGMKYAEERYYKMEYERFITDLGRRESGNNWKCINRFGFFGEWQFAESTVQFLGFKQVTLKKFRSNPETFPPELQEKALESLIKVNNYLLRDYEHYIGKTIAGVTVTKSGMIAAAHLGGATSVKKFLKSGGHLDRKDALGTAVSNYMKKFGFYDLDL